MPEMDAVDWRILEVLQQNARITNAELAARIHRSESSCHRRRRRLEDEGVIESYGAIINHAAIGRPTSVFVEITLLRQAEETLDAFEEAVRDCPEIMAAYFMMGDADYLLHIVVADTSDFERIYKAYLSRFPGVANIRSRVALRTVTKRIVHRSRS
jgi:Lrp/AsnC family leucine-responsive transcriptional regulator